MVKYIFVLLLTCFVSKLHSQSFTFNQTLSDSLPDVKANSIKIIDLNRDGYSDVILSGYDASRYGVYLDVRYGSNDGQLNSGLEYEFITYPDTIGEYIGGLGNISLADVNRDGNVDLYLNGSARSHLMINSLNDLEISGIISREVSNIENTRGRTTYISMPNVLPNDLATRLEMLIKAELR